ncbi:short-chain dehydrogenase/reductase [Blastomyces gilchristii SLH14081]|uniref:Short-chain dehydrogenase/reductase n=2 Tax=Blastomyces TaxID=229219 RepID=A0A179UGY3_BLAGS|nr:short-chain dehydrogenase/reductase [Blastomyces gilchristii SLH14081]EGE77498.2 short-chain dehydrogenase/reductase [Blastomyces dermatitidis ATCC 18188]EQL33569.1 hypothetical protein BDFG_04329 [Blastomyces dermatitidis ATCC 26199]OAT05772.1 short-chain dehydrogenase/reductase [Blastomyces gilchristii SLH14081]
MQYQEQNSILSIYTRPLSILTMSYGNTFDPVKDIPPLNNKVILITGGNNGLGKQSVLEFAKHNPSRIWLAARNVQKAQQAIDDIKQQLPEACKTTISILELDLSSFESIKNAAKIVLAESDRLDILMLNAGIMAVPPGLTKDGYEIQFGTNHMGHALLTKLLLPLLIKTAESGSNTPNGGDVRVVSLSSHGHTHLPKGCFNFESLQTTGEKLGAYTCYFQSKLANVLWARQLAKLYPQFTVAAIHPGVVRTQLMEGATGSAAIIRMLVRVGSRLLTPVDRGVRNQLWASVSKDVRSGEYYEPIGVKGKVSDDGKDDQLARELWEWTEKELRAHCV